MTRKVVHISFSSSGGAGRVASQLVESQKKLGWDAQLLTLTNTNLRDDPYRLPAHTLLAGLDHVAVKSTSFDGLVSLTRNLLSQSFQNQMSDADVVHLHWINGVTSLDEVRKVAPGAKIVWTLHDMNPFTGACHHSFGCVGFTADCSSCPAVRGLVRAAVSGSLRKKANSYGLAGNLTVVSPSRWLAGLAHASSAMGGLDIRFLPNPVGEIFLKEASNLSDSSSSEAHLRTPQFCLIAKDLNDPLKNVDFAAKAFGIFQVDNPDARLSLIGKNGGRFAGVQGVDLLGELDAPIIRDVLARSSALLIPSLAENAPVVVAEAACVGTPTIASNIPALAELTGGLGYGALVSSPQKMAEEMTQFYKNMRTADGLTNRQNLKTKAQSLFSPENIGQRYINIYRGGE